MTPIKQFSPIKLEGMYLIDGDMLRDYEKAYTQMQIINMVEDTERQIASGVKPRDGRTVFAELRSKHEKRIHI